MPQTKVFTVFGATGNQGGSVIRAVQAHPILSKELQLRGVTRDISKSNAQALAAKGVQVVQADLNDIESVKEAVQGSHVVFGTTNYWETASKEVELRQGKNIADACKATGVTHLVWSALPNATAISGGELRQVHHFDSKAEITEYIEQIKGDMFATYFMPGLYMQNFQWMIRRGQDGIVALEVPWDAKETNVPLFDAATDSGTFVVGILSAPLQPVNGKQVQAVSQWITPKEIIDTFNDKTGYKAVFRTVDGATFMRSQPPEAATELMENMLLVRDYSYYGKGADLLQLESDGLLRGAQKKSWASFIDANSPWQVPG